MQFKRRKRCSSSKQRYWMELCLKTMLIIIDQAVYAKASQITWKNNKVNFRNMLFRLVDFIFWDLFFVFTSIKSIALMLFLSGKSLLTILLKWSKECINVCLNVTELLLRLHSNPVNWMWAATSSYVKWKGRL